MISTFFWTAIIFWLVVYGIKWRLEAVGYTVSYGALASQLINLLTFGSWRETLCGRVGRKVSEGVEPVWLWSAAKTFLDLVHREEGHCEMSAVRSILRDIKGTIPWLDPSPEVELQDAMEARYDSFAQDPGQR